MAGKRFKNGFKSDCGNIINTNRSAIAFQTFIRVLLQILLVESGEMMWWNVAESLIPHKKRRFLLTSFAHQSHGFELKTVLLSVAEFWLLKMNLILEGCVLYV